LLYLNEVFEQNGLKANVNNKAVPVSYNLINRHGKSEATSHFTFNNRRPVFSIKTGTGNEIVSTASHLHLVMNSAGFWVYKKTEKVAVGDYLVCMRRYESSIGQDASITDGEIYFIGVVIADGCLAEHRVGVTNNDPVVMDQIVTHGQAILGVAPHRYPKSASPGSFDYHFNTTLNVSRFYEMMGWKPGIAKDKHLGLFVRQLSKSQIRFVLQGYFDCECSIGATGIEVTSASRRLLYEVKAVLQAHFGIISVLKEKKIAAYPENEYWRLTLGGAEARRYIEQIGFRSDTRVRDSQVLLNDRNYNTNIDVIPNCGTLVESLYDASETTKFHNFETRDYKGIKARACLTYPSLETILALDWSDGVPLNRLREIRDAQYFYDRVTAVDPCEPQPTFDFQVPGTHSFVVANMIVHNSSTEESGE
jgi:hypothetical protein